MITQENKVKAVLVMANGAREALKDGDKPDIVRTAIDCINIALFDLLGIPYGGSVETTPDTIEALEYYKALCLEVAQK